MWITVGYDFEQFHGRQGLQQRRDRPICNLYPGCAACCFPRSAVLQLLSRSRLAETPCVPYALAAVSDANHTVMRQTSDGRLFDDSEEGRQRAKNHEHFCTLHSNLVHAIAQLDLSKRSSTVTGSPTTSSRPTAVSLGATSDSASSSTLETPAVSNVDGAAEDGQRTRPGTISTQRAANHQEQPAQGEAENTDAAYRAPRYLSRRSLRTRQSKRAQTVSDHESNIATSTH